MKVWPFGRKTESRNGTYQDLWGSGEPIRAINGESIHTALSLVAVYASIGLIADQIASFPLETYIDSGSGTKVRTNDPELVLNPTNHGTSYDWTHRLVTSLLLRGNAYGLILERDAKGTPTLVEWLHPDEVSLEQDDTAYVPKWYWRDGPIDNANFIHIPGFTLPGRVLGLSPIKFYKLTIETGLRAQDFGVDWFRNGSTPAAVLEMEDEVTFEQAEEIKKRFKAAAKGREPVAMGLGMTYKPIGVPAEESQFLATIKATKTDIASIYHIPPEMIGGDAPSSMTYQNVEQQKILFFAMALRPYIQKIERALSQLLPSGQSIEFNANPFLQADTKTRYEAHHLAVTDGWMTLDEVRAVENKPPFPNGLGKFASPTAPQQPPLSRMLQEAAVLLDESPDGIEIMRDILTELKKHSE
jgi:HK97 family phage portal protein